MRKVARSPVARTARLNDTSLASRPDLLSRVSYLASMPWGLDFGPVHIGHGGLKLKPQLKLGVEVGEVKAGIGIPNIQNGIGLECEAEVSKTQVGHGKTIWAALQNLKVQGGVSPELDNAIQTLMDHHPAKMLQKFVMDKLHVDLNQERPNVDVIAKVKASVGAHAKFCVGMPDEAWLSSGWFLGLSLLLLESS